MAPSGNAASFLRRDRRSSCTAQTGTPSIDERGGRVVVVRGDAEDLHVNTGWSATRCPSCAIGVQPAGSRRSARLASHGKGREHHEIHDVRRALPSTPATAAATRRYRFHKRLARACHTCRRYDLGQDAGELRVGVVHVEHFIAEDLFEDRARRRIVVDDIAIDREAAGGRFFRHMQEREQPMIGLAFDGQIVEAVAAGKRARVEQRRLNESSAVGEARRRAGGTDRRGAARRSRARGTAGAGAGPG